MSNCNAGLTPLAASLSNICLIRVRREQLSKSVTGCAQLRVRRQP